jgi:ribosome biogenesis GTPase
MDTPGVRTLGLTAIDDGLDLAFGDLAELAARCRFRDCGHGGEPGCAVTAAVDDGSLSVDRLDSFHKLQREAAFERGRAERRQRRAAARSGRKQYRRKRRVTW